ncbi:PH domain-containing protein [Kangiella sp. TOML190]|uniref:PH domain-containing protein n=1 Tax=Kangiella sp. TOML190 TaxID=2931351 RepID=UPI00203DE822|nr:PH domain-containing protein [Kangiella sp. TOML190]
MSLFEQIPEDAQSLSPKSITITRIIFSIFSIGVLALAVFIAVVSGEWTRFGYGLVAAILLWLFGFFWSKKRYDYSRWWFSEEGLYLQRGVFWRKRILVPQNRVQHTDVAQGPLDRKYHLGKLVVHTAGTRDASVTLSGVELEVANELRDRLIDSEQTDAV